MEHKLIAPAFGGDGNTLVDPLTLAILIGFGGLIFFVQHRKVACLILIITTLVPLSQGVVVGGFDFNIVRIITLLGWVKVIAASDSKPWKLNAIDKTFILWVISRTVTYVLLWESMGALVNRLGYAFDAMGIYFLMRYLINDLEDVKGTIHALALTSIALAIMMMIEHSTGNNPFATFGGFYESTLTRAGELRCRGPFQHTLLAGSFGAAQLPLFVGLFVLARERRKIAAVGICAATVIVFATYSSGPFGAYAAGILALCAFRFRRYLGALLKGAALGLIGLHIIMNDPVWALIMRARIFGGSAGWHRYQLIDQFIRRADEWWLFGTRYTDHWGHISFDVSNWYVRMGIDGGIVTLGLFLFVSVLCFRTIGKSVSTFAKDEKEQFFVWGIGSSLVAHLVSFVGVSYWDQTIVVWYTLLAWISAISSSATMGSKVAKTTQNWEAESTFQSEASKNKWPAFNR